MLIKHLQEKQKKLLNQQTDFYTPTGIHVYFQEELLNDEVNVERVISRVENKIPHHLLSEIEMMIIGWFEEFDERNLTAFYENGTVFISHIQDDEDDMFDDIVHEISHSLESPHGYFLYGDEKIKKEFLRKRKHLHDILWAHGHKIPESVFSIIEYDEDFDMLLYKQIGYDKLASLMRGLFISPYAATSLREYFATGFTEFYLNPNQHNYLKTISPSLYKKIILLQNPETLDTSI